MSSKAKLVSEIQWKAVSDELPDADITVLIHCVTGNEPVWVGFYDGETWRELSGADLGLRCVKHWADLPEPPNA